MKALEVQKFIRAEGLSALVSSRAIQAKRHKEAPELVLLKYNQILSDMQDPIVQECRGIILNENSHWAVVSFPYKKFFNHGETGAAEINWSTARVQEKLDGSLTTMYYWGGRWRVATSGTPDGLSNVGAANLTFEALFWRTFEAMGYAKPAAHWRDTCFMFELMAPENRVIVVHDEPRLVLHGARNLLTYEERDPKEIAESMEWEVVEEHPLQTIDDVLEASKHLRPLVSEGYVVCDDKFNRVKIKSPNYLLLHRAKDGLSPRRLLEVARTNEGTEFLAYFPELENEYQKHRSAIETLSDAADKTFARLKAECPDRKSFALEAQKTGYQSVLFALLSEHVTQAREWFAKATYAAVERQLGYKDLAEKNEVSE